MLTLPRRAALGLAAAALTRPVAAQEAGFPNRPVRFIVPFPPGQAGDTHARIGAEALAARWPHRPVVENRAGGAGSIGMEAAARAAPDGYTYAYTSIGPMTVLPAMVPNVPYDPAKDFAAVALLSITPLLLVVHPSLPVNTIQEFVAYTKVNALDYASGGPGTVQHMSGELLRHRLGLKLNHIAYRGSGPAVTDTLAGTVLAMVDSVASATPHVRAGRLRALALTGGHGVPGLPGIPSIGDTVVPGFDVVGWTGLFAPAGTPPGIIRKVNADLLAGLAGGEYRERLEATGTVIPPPWSPEEAQDFTLGQVAFWKGVIREAGLRIDG